MGRNGSPEEVEEIPKRGQPPKLEPDIAQLVEEINNPKDLFAAVDNYTFRNSDIQKEKVMESQFMKIKKYKDCIYFGEVLNGKRHGTGTHLPLIFFLNVLSIGVMVYVNGRVYEGEWENELKHGKGLEISPNGNTYKGQFLNGKPEGFGNFRWYHGEMYEGQWRAGLKHGSGIWKGANGESYVGEWKNGKPDGYGVHVFKNGKILSMSLGISNNSYNL